MKRRIYIFNAIGNKKGIIIYFISLITLCILLALVHKSSPLVNYYITVFGFGYIAIIVLLIVLLLVFGIILLIKYLSDLIVGKPKSWTIELNEEIRITNDKESFSISPDDLIKIKAFGDSLFLKTAEKRFYIYVSFDRLEFPKNNLFTKSNFIMFHQFISDLEEYFLEKGFNLKKSSSLIGFYFSKK